MKAVYTRALSIRQPWAWLIVNGYKDVENRSWTTKIRGWIGIHAGLKFDKDAYEWVKFTFPDIKMPIIEDFHRGGLVGKVRLIECYSYYNSPWFSGPYGFVLADATTHRFKPCPGKLGFFTPTTV